MKKPTMQFSTQSRHYATIVLVGLFYYLLLVLFLPGPAALFIRPLFAGTMAVATVSIARKHLAALRRRADDVSGPWAWNVLVNDVAVGSLSDAQIAALTLAGYTDRRLISAQIVNVVRALFSAFNALLLATPHVVFWLVAAWFVYNTTDFMHIVALAQKATPQEIAAALHTVGWAYFTFSIVAFGAASALSGSFYGLHNVFRSALCQTVRKELRVSADGRITLLRVETILASASAAT